jgi:threonine dehydrogenase-like Zn-dependent dehydrogenase
MQGAVFLGDRKAALRDFTDPEPGMGEVVVAIRASGMCGSDLHYYRGPSNDSTASGTRIVGHEPAGVVHSIGPGVSPDTVRVGDRVMVHHYAGCTTCDACRSGWPQMCTTRPTTVFGTDAHGAHAPLMCVPATTLVPLDPMLSFEAGAAIGCGTGTAWGGLERLGDLGGATLAIFGQGPVGLSATMLATARGARVIALDLEPRRLEQAQRFGAIATIDPREVDPVSALRDLTHGRGVALVLETSGASVAASAGLQALAPWGRFCVVGMGGEVRFNVLDLHRSQMTLMTSWSMSLVDQRRCAEFIVRNELPVDDLFSHRWKLDDVVQAYYEFDKQDAGKGVFVFD